MTKAKYRKLVLLLVVVVVLVLVYDSKGINEIAGRHSDLNKRLSMHTFKCKYKADWKSIKAIYSQSSLTVM
jgi:acid phosphatase family membrane protein YuiD